MKIKQNSLILISFLVITLTLIAACNNDHKKYLSIVEKFRVSGITLIDETINSLSILAEAESSSSELLTTLADIIFIRYQYKSLNLNDVESALIYMNRAIIQTPDQADYLQKRALYYLILNQASDAVGDLNKALVLQPAHAEAWSLKIEMLLSNNRLQYAEDTAYQAMLNWESIAEPAAQFAEIFYVNQIWAVAIDLLEIAELDTADSYFMQGVCNQELEQNNEAIKAYENALFKAESDVTRFRLSTVLLKQQQYQPALRQVRILIKKFPEEAKYWSQLAQIYAVQGNASRAIATLLNVERFGDELQKQNASKSIFSLSEVL